jgi:hypothetical protein
MLLKTLYVRFYKWWTKPVGRGQGDVFAAKVRRKGKNALGLFVSVSGFIADFRPS